MTSLGDAVIRIAKAAKRRDAPTGFKAAARAVKTSPVDLVVEIVKWAGSIDDRSLPGLDKEFAGCCSLAAEAVKAYGFHGLGEEAAALLERLQSGVSDQVSGLRKEKERDD